MSDIVLKQESTLTNKTTPAMTDLLRMVGSDDHSYKALVSDVAKAIIETYAGSTLAGSAQSVKSALDALNSKWEIPIASNTDLNSITAVGFYRSASSSVTASLAHCPFTGSGFCMVVPSNTLIMQILFVGGTGGTMFHRARTSGGWNMWYKFEGVQMAS